MSEPLPICPACKYPLEGLADEGTCPECGEPYTHQASRLLSSMPERHELFRGLWLPTGFIALWLFLTALCFAVGFVDGGSFIFIVLVPITLLWLFVATPLILAHAASRFRAGGGRGSWFKTYGRLGIAIRIIAIINIMIMAMTAIAFFGMVVGGLTSL